MSEKRTAEAISGSSARVLGNRLTAEVSGSSLPSLAEAKRLDAAVPGTLVRVLEALEAQERHRQRLEWAELAARVFGQVCGLATVGVLALLARHFVDHGAATQGAAVIGTAAVGIVTVFVTGRLANKGSGTPDTEDKG